jgi:DNA-binding NarL/FixJ family response regulator
MVSPRTWVLPHDADPSPNLGGRHGGSTAGGITLSRRQQDVLALLAEGLPARAIAARLGIAETTARNHIQGLLRRLGCHSQLQAVALARRSRLI